MFEIKAKTVINAPLEKVWEFMKNVKGWWPSSNPQHIDMQILSQDEEIKKGTQIKLKEKIAGVPGEAVGEISDFVDMQKVTWQSRNAVYSLYGVKVVVEEGVTWSLESGENGVELSARVWARFPDTFKGRAMEWVFKNILDGERKDYEHAKKELEYIKDKVESGQGRV